MVSAREVSPLRSMITANRSPILNTADGTSSSSLIQPAENQYVVMQPTDIVIFLSAGCESFPGKNFPRGPNRKIV